MKTIIAIHSVDSGTCTFSGKKGDGAVVSFANGAIKEQFLSWVSLRKLAGFQFKEKANVDREGSERNTQAVPGEGVRPDPKG